MKKYLRDIVLVVVTAVIASGVGVAAYNYNAASIEYSPSDKTWKVSTVAEAINSLVNDTRTSVMNYSTDEQVVGRWIDGKPIYQKTFIGSFSTGIPRTSWGYAYLEPNMDSIINAVGYYDNDSFAPIVDIDVIDSNAGQVALITANGRTLQEITIQYTKTTDTGNSNNG